MSADQRRRSAAGRLYGVLLVAYPAAFRARFERDMRETFVADCRRARERGSRAYVAFWARTAVEAVRYGVAERIGSRGSERAAHPDGGATMPSRLAVDLRDACRALRTTPVVVAAAVLSLALGIGANTALFSIFNSLVLKALPVRDPEQLVIIPHGSWTNPIWEQIRDREERIGAGAFAFSVERFDLSPQGQTDLVDGAFASGGMFQVLGLTPARGRLLTPADDVRGGGPTGGVAVVSYGLWQRRLGGGEDVVGRTITIDRVPFTIVGVMPPAFSGPVVGRALDLVVPIGDEPLIRGTGTVLDARSTWWLEIMLRLRPGQTIAQATAALRAAQPQIRAATIPSNFGPEMEARYLTEPFLLEPASTGPSELRGQFGQPLMALIVVVGAVLLIACANIANLLLARAAARRRDLTVRLALGASRLRIARQLFCESLILAGAGTVLGLLLARAGSRLLVQQFSSAAGTVTLDTPLDLHVLAFTAAIGALTALIFGVAPALGARHMAAYEALKDQSRTIAGDRRLGLRNVLVVSQVALSLALVVTAGLFIRTFQSLSAVPLGLRVDPLLTVTLDVKRSPAEGAARLQLFERLRDVATSTPGVKAAAISRIEPLSGAGWNAFVDLPDAGSSSPGARLPWVNGVTPGWFQTYGVRVLAGRDFGADDRLGRPLVAIVNQAFARRFLGGRNPIGRRVSMGGPSRQDGYEVVGLVADSAYRSPREGLPATIYVPFAQIDRLGPEAVLAAEVTSPGAWAAVESRLSQALARVDAGVAFSFRPFADRVRSTMIGERLVAALSGFFGALALLLAGIGLYGVTAYAVSRRRTEIGVRMALGAEPATVVRLVLARVAWLVGLGVLIGAGATLWASQFLRTLLFGLTARDPATFIVATLLLIGVGLLTAWLPARRASRIDPTEVLREG